MTALAHSLLDDFSGCGAIDVTCHIGQWPYRLGASATENDLQGYIARHGLTRVWVSHLAALFGFDTRTGNEDCLRRCGGNPKLRPMAVINPLQERWRTELQWASESGFLGIRVAPGYHAYGSEFLIDVTHAAAQYGLVTQLLIRLDDKRVRHPRSPASDVDIETVEAVLRAVPESLLLLSGLNWVEWQQLQGLVGGRIADTVRADFWHMNGPFGIVEQLHAEEERWVFGSGFPVQAPEPSMLQLTASLLPLATQLAIARENAERLVASIPENKHDRGSEFRHVH